MIPTRNQNHLDWMYPLLRMAAAMIIAALVATACAATHNEGCGKDMKSALNQGLRRQVINAEAPSNSSVAEGLPGDIASQIYKRRYIKTMTEDKDEDNKKASNQFD